MSSQCVALQVTSRDGGSSDWNKGTQAVHVNINITDLREVLPLSGVCGLVSHPSSVSWEVKLMAFLVIKLFRDTGG